MQTLSIKKWDFFGYNASEKELIVCEKTFKTNTNKMFFQSAHIHLIDALMMAYMLEMISVEKVVSSVKRFSNLSAKELPFDLEDAMLFWMNKVRLTHWI